MISVPFREALVEEILGGSPGSVFVIRFEHDPACPQLVGPSECVCNAEPRLRALDLPPAPMPTAISLRECRAALRSYVRAQHRKGETIKAALVERVLAGDTLIKSTDTPVMRHGLLRRLAGILAFVTPNLPDLTLRELVRPSLDEATPEAREMILDRVRLAYAEARTAHAASEERNRLSWAQLARDLGKDRS
ncbi:hypothetical protein BH11MYX3_BH11MYX3_04640 [soil metagenome]